MNLLEEGNLLLQALNASLQVQPSQSGIVNILDTTQKQNNCYHKFKKEADRNKVVDERVKKVL